MISKTEQKITYPLSLLLSTGKKKTAEALAKICYKSGDTMLRLLEKQSVNSEELICLAKEFFDTDFLDVILDDTLLEKMYSKLIEGSADNYDSSKGHVYRSLCSVVAMLSNGWYGLPVVHEFWMKKEILSNGYKTKVQIGKEIIEFLGKFIRIKTVILDGLYATKEMLCWLQEKNIKYEMRFHSNRLIRLNEKDIPTKVRDHKTLQLIGKRRAKTVKVIWNGLPIYVTAVKRINKKGISSIVYQVSNVKLSAREHVRIYGYRWNIEVFFRTAKQSLGLTECQSRKLSSQKNHVYNVFFAYIILQFERKKKHLKNPECALRKIKRKSYNALISYLPSLDQIFQTFGVVIA
jgi:SRSO17 transposase